MTIFLTILKVILYILLALLAILLLLMLVVLFSKFRYRVRAKGEGEMSTVKAEAIFTWLFGVLRVKVRYQDEQIKTQFKIFGKTFGKKKRQKKDHCLKNEKKQDGDKEKESQEKSQKDSINAERKSATEKQSVENTEILLEKTAQETVPPSFEERTTNETSAKGMPTTQKTVKNEKRQEKKNLVWKIEHTWKKICAKIKKISEQKEHWEAILEEETYRQVLAKVIREVKRIVLHIRPKKVEGKCVLGCKDPYYTGKIFAAAAVFYPFYGDDIELTPDFSKQVCKGDVFLEGKFSMSTFARSLIVLVLDRQVRGVIKTIRNKI